MKKIVKLNKVFFSIILTIVLMLATTNIGFSTWLFNGNALSSKDGNIAITGNWGFGGTPSSEQPFNETADGTPAVQVVGDKVVVNEGGLYVDDSNTATLPYNYDAGGSGGNVTITKTGSDGSSTVKNTYTVAQLVGADNADNLEKLCIQPNLILFNDFFCRSFEGCKNLTTLEIQTNGVNFDGRLDTQEDKASTKYDANYTHADDATARDCVLKELFHCMYYQSNGGTAGSFFTHTTNRVTIDFSQPSCTSVYVYYLGQCALALWIAYMSDIANAYYQEDLKVGTDAAITSCSYPANPEYKYINTIILSDLNGQNTTTFTLQNLNISCQKLRTSSNVKIYNQDGSNLNLNKNTYYYYYKISCDLVGNNQGLFAGYTISLNNYRTNGALYRNGSDTTVNTAISQSYNGILYPRGPAI